MNEAEKEQRLRALASCGGVCEVCKKPLSGSKTPCTWAGTYTSNDNYQVEFEASGYGWYMKQTRWEPEEEEIVCNKVKIISVNGGNIELTDELKERLEGEIMDACEGGEFEERWPDER